jgi:hypothetical protein
VCDTITLPENEANVVQVHQCKGIWSLGSRITKIHDTEFLLVCDNVMVSYDPKTYAILPMYNLEELANSIFFETEELLLCL